MTSWWIWSYFPGQSWTLWRSVVVMYIAPRAMGLRRDGIWSWRNAVCENRYGIISPTCSIFPYFLHWWVLSIHTKQPDSFTPTKLLCTYAAVMFYMPEETWVRSGWPCPVLWSVLWTVLLASYGARGLDLPLVPLYSYNRMSGALDFIHLSVNSFREETILTQSQLSEQTSVLGL